jgi:hypothetical protein
VEECNPLGAGAEPRVDEAGAQRAACAAANQEQTTRLRQGRDTDNARGNKTRFSVIACWFSQPTRLVMKVRCLGGEIHPRQASGPLPSDCWLIVLVYSISVKEAFMELELHAIM